MVKKFTSHYTHTVVNNKGANENVCIRGLNCAFYVNIDLSKFSKDQTHIYCTFINTILSCYMYLHLSRQQCTFPYHESHAQWGSYLTKLFVAITNII